MNSQKPWSLRGSTLLDAYANIIAEFIELDDAYAVVEMSEKTLALATEVEKLEDKIEGLETKIEELEYDLKEVKRK